MLITFKSKAASDIVMYKEHARRLLDLLDKDLQRGIITAAETDQAIEKLQTEIAVERAKLAEQETASGSDVDSAPGDDNQLEPVETVSFATRAYPLLEMLRAARASGKDVVWGV